MAKRGFGAVAASLCLCGAVSGMTMAELQSAVDAAESGAVVELTGDVDVTESLNVNGKKLTLRSPEGRKYALRRNADVPLFTVTGAGTDVRLENLEYDGLKAAGQFGADWLIQVSAGCLTLGEGAVFRNLYARHSGPITVRANGRIVMENGSTISNFVNDVYATAVSVGTGGDSDSGATFEMKGGTITGCTSTTVVSGDERYMYGAAVYVYGGFFVMTGGIITGNTATHTVGGLLMYSGNVDVSGTAVITGNTGQVANDVHRNGGSFYVSSGYCGRMTVLDRNTPADGTTSPIYSHQERGGSDYSLVTGMGNVACQDDPEWVLDGYSTSDGYARWRRRLASTECHGTVATMNELKAVLRPDDVIAFHRDIFLDANGCLTFDGTKATLKSAEGASARIVKAAGETGISLFSVRNGASVRFEDIAIDGSNLLDWVPLINVTAGARVELGAETVISNVVTSSQGGVAIRDSGTVVTMEEGARFVRFCARNGACYGAAVLVGGGGSPDVPPKFEMRGGEITECEIELTEGDVWSGYGGAVYVYGGQFLMSGGHIHGNMSKTTCPGVLYYSGRIELSGTARIDGNVSPYADLFFTTTQGDIQIVGDFRGHVGISNGTKALGENTYVKAAEGATGAWCLFQTHPDLGSVDWCGQVAADGVTINWAEAVGKVDYMSVASVADANEACPKTVSINPADLTTLPHAFKGRAAEIDGVTVSLTFDPDSVKQYIRQNKTTIPLFSSDGPMVGTVNFLLPTYCPPGFQVAKSADGKGYYLSYGRGLILILQ